MFFHRSHGKKKINIWWFQKGKTRVQTCVNHNWDLSDQITFNYITIYQ